MNEEQSLQLVEEHLLPLETLSSKSCSFPLLFFSMEKARKTASRARVSALARVHNQRVIAFTVDSICALDSDIWSRPQPAVITRSIGGSD